MGELEAVFSAVGACAWGGVDYGKLAPYLLKNVPVRWEFEPETVLVAAFPYYAGESEGNLSLYARGRDYHEVVTERLTLAAQALQGKYPEMEWVVGSDNSPIPEVHAGALAGLGVKGRNGLLLVPQWGSYVFLGSVAVSWGSIRGDQGPIGVDKGSMGDDEGAVGCVSCGKCAAICPGGAISGEKVERERCLSHLTQKKGELTAEQRALVSGHGRIWGCDLCQQVCPYNRQVPRTPLEEFSCGLVDSLEPSDVVGVTNRQLREAFPHRAFTWRGAEVLRRNMALREEWIENKL